MLFICCLFLFFESRMLLLNFVATPLYLYFAVFVVPRRVANAKLLFTFVSAGNRLFLSPFWALRDRKKFNGCSAFLCCFLMMLRNFHCF